MNFYSDMISKLTDLFRKDEESNISKLFKVVSKQLEDIKNTLETMEEWRDIDEARGVQLDKLGSEIVQEFRNGQTDQEYRLRIKTKIIANLSKGDIETINNVLSTFLGDKFIGVTEMWALDDPIIPAEPAGILITTRVHTPFPAGVIGRVTAGGITIYWHVIMEPKDVTVETSTTEGESEPFVFSGELYPGPIYDRSTKGVVNDATIKPQRSSLTGTHEYPSTPGYSGIITDSTSGSSDAKAMNVFVDYDEGYATFEYAGEEWSEGYQTESSTTLDHQDATGSKEYRYSGEFYPGEEE